MTASEALRSLRILVRRLSEWDHLAVDSTDVGRVAISATVWLIVGVAYSAARVAYVSDDGAHHAGTVELGVDVNDYHSPSMVNRAGRFGSY
jgi:hypothetical protein